ncbi:hypothetical protein Tco_0739202, partial [Tanacetum coccineum]
LLNSMSIDEIEARNNQSQPDVLLKRPYDDQDPPENHKVDNDRKKQKREGKSPLRTASNVQTSEYDMLYVDACSREYSWFNTLVEDKEDPKYDEDVQNCVESITKLEYNLEEVKLEMCDEMDWINPESSNDQETRFYTDFTKPLPLVGPKGNKKISIINFFNMDLHYLRHEDKEGKYALSLTKYLTARYDINGIERDIDILFSLNVAKYDVDAMLGIYHWPTLQKNLYKSKIIFGSGEEVYSNFKIVTVKHVVERQLDYGLLIEIKVLRADGVETSTNASGSQPMRNTRNDRIQRPSSSSQKNKLEVHPRNVKFNLNKNNFVSDCNSNIKHVVSNSDDEYACSTCNIVQIVFWYLNSRYSKHMTRRLDQLINFVSKFTGTVRFMNDHFVAIMGYGDLQIGNVYISRVYYLKGLGHNLFSVGQFFDTDLEADVVSTAFDKLDILQNDTDSY